MSDRPSKDGFAIALVGVLLLTLAHHCAYAAAVTSAGPDPLARSATTYSDVVHQSDLMVRARDGVLLATDIYRPATAGIATWERLPVLPAP
jgi:predicted acyl esterase